MDLDANIRTFALADATIAAAIGTAWHIDHIPDDASYPLVKMSQVTETPNRSHQGRTGRTALYQLDLYGTTKSSVNALRDAILSRFDDYSGTLSDITAGYIFARNVTSGYEPATRKFWRVMELDIGTND